MTLKLYSLIMNIMKNKGRRKQFSFFFLSFFFSLVWKMLEFPPLPQRLSLTKEVIKQFHATGVYVSPASGLHLVFWRIVWDVPAIHFSLCNLHMMNVFNSIYDRLKGNTETLKHEEAAQWLATIREIIPLSI